MVFKITTLNVRGLQNKKKRRSVFSHLATLDFTVCLLQEVHLKSEKDKVNFSREWVKGESRWSIGGVHSSGVGLLCGNNREIEILNSFSFVHGRALVVDINWRNNQLRIINIYAHTDPAARKELLKSLDTCFMTNRLVCIAGDFNISLDKGGNISLLQALIQKFNLMDTYRSVNKKDAGFTWENNSGAKSRIDYIFIPHSMKVSDARISPVYYSDHSQLSVSVELQTSKYGKGYWKINNGILLEKDFKDIFQIFFNRCVELKSLYSSAINWWDDTKKKNKTVHTNVL